MSITDAGPLIVDVVFDAEMANAVAVAATVEIITEGESLHGVRWPESGGDFFRVSKRANRIARFTDFAQQLCWTNYHKEPRTIRADEAAMLDLAGVLRKRADDADREEGGSADALRYARAARTVAYAVGLEAT